MLINKYKLKLTYFEPEKKLIKSEKVNAFLLEWRKQ